MINSSLPKAPLRICALASFFLLAGCSLKQDMAQQPKNRPPFASDFFTMAVPARPLVEIRSREAPWSSEELTVPKDSNAFLCLLLWSF